MKRQNSLRSRVNLFFLALWLLAGCSRPLNSPKAGTAVMVILPTPTPAYTQEKPGKTSNLTKDQIATLTSLEKVDEHPLYSMHYVGAYAPLEASDRGTGEGINPGAVLPALSPESPGWACSLFTALWDSENKLYGRNFDWEHSPAILLFTDPPDGYASVSMVDFAYLGFTNDRANHLLDLSLDERKALLMTPYLPFDGMNEHGLVIGMAAVPPGGMQADPAKKTKGSLGIIREILDQARNIDQAVALFQRYNIDFNGGPPIHYLVAEPAGRAALVEFFQGQMEVIYNEHPWHMATNFLRSSVEGDPQGQCWRYDRISQRLEETGGKLSVLAAMDLLSKVSQESTQWSIVYGMSTGEIDVVMGKHYTQVHTFRFNLLQK